LALTPEALARVLSRLPGPEPEPEPEEPGPEPEPEGLEEPAGQPYGKFQGGFFGAFASLASYHGGLAKLLGALPEADDLAQLEREHCGLDQGFGASDAPFALKSGLRSTSKNRNNLLGLYIL
jgi:hypothetical protein